MTAASYRKLTYEVAAGATQQITRNGDFFHVLRADQEFQVGWDNGPLSPFLAGLEYEVRNGGAFRSTQIRNDGPTMLTIEVGIGAGGIRDARLLISTRIDTKAATPDVLTTGAPVVAATAANTALAAANVQRKEVILANQGAGTVYVNGSAGAGAGQGVPLAAGAIMVLENAGPIYARNDTGAAVNVSVTQSEFAP